MLEEMWINLVWCTFLTIFANWMDLNIFCRIIPLPSRTVYWKIFSHHFYFFYRTLLKLIEFHPTYFSIFLPFFFHFFRRPDPGNRRRKKVFGCYASFCGLWIWFQPIIIFKYAWNLSKYYSFHRWFIGNYMESSK